MTKLYETPVKAIRKKCLDCTCDQWYEIRHCTVIKCPLYAYRLGKRPDHDTLSQLEEFINQIG